ncbi:hypothetical protein IWZ01DRAFT_510385 [Phyllosticta capitalensis]
MAAAPASANRGADSDHDWEYEYDDTETQDVYLSLDLTSHTNVAGPKKGFNKLEHDIFADEVGKNKTRNQHQDGDNEQNLQEQGDDMEAEEDEEDVDRLQVVGLHTNNPIVSYQGQAFTCKWASTVGTDLFFARALDADPDDDQPAPLRQLGAFNMLGASSTRLVATAAKLRERSSAEQRGMVTAGPSTSKTPAAANPSSFAFTPSADLPHFLLPADATRAQKRQATFLENFAAVKARLGEQDEVRTSSFTSRGLNRSAAADATANDAAGPSTPRRAANPRQSVSFLSANESTPADGNASPQSPASAASPSATEPAPTRARGRGKVGRPRGRGRGRGRRARSRGTRGRGRKTVAADEGDGEGAGESVPTPGAWEDAMTGVETSAGSPSRGSVGEALTQQQQQQRQQEERQDAMQE